MKKIVVILVFVSLSVLICANLFAEKTNFTISAVSDVRLRTWLSKSGAVSHFDNNGLVKTGFGPAFGYFYNFNEKFETGIESSIFIREAQSNKFFLQTFLNGIARWKFFGNKECTMFLDFGTGPVVSYLGGNFASYGMGFELGCGMRWSLKNNKYLSLKTNLVGVLEKYSNAVTPDATVFVLSAQPISVGFSWKY